MKTLLASLLILSGCASDTSILRIVEYQANATVGEAGGIVVHQSPVAGPAYVTINYKGEKGTVYIVSSPKE